MALPAMLSFVLLCVCTCICFAAAHGDEHCPGHRHDHAHGHAHDHAHDHAHHGHEHHSALPPAHPLNLLSSRNPAHCFFYTDRAPDHSHVHSHSHSSSPLTAAISSATVRLSRPLNRLLHPLHRQPPARAALIASLLTSSVSLVSVILLPFMRTAHRILLPFSAGALASDLLYHLLPHMYISPSESTSTIFIVSLACFAIIDMVLHRLSPCSSSSSLSTSITTAYINLLADALHNFCDGLTLASAFLLSSTTGISTTLAIILHELPQEMADFTLLLRAGMSPRAAIAANLSCALTALLGTYVALRLVPYGGAVTNGSATAATSAVTPVAAGALTYMTFSSVVPDVVHQVVAASQQRSVGVFVVQLATAVAAATAGAVVVASIESLHEH